MQARTADASRTTASTPDEACEPLAHRRSAWRPRTLWIFTRLMAWSVLLAPVQALLLNIKGANRHVLPRFAFRRWAKALGMTVRVVGAPAQPGPVLFVANHVSYLDIVALGASLDASFLAKREIRGWPVMGWLARLGRTAWTDRRRSDVGRESRDLADRIRRGDSLILFPEATTGDAQSLMPFKSALFLHGRTHDCRPIVQPVSIAYVAAAGQTLDAAGRRRYAWCDNRPMLPHLLWILNQGPFEVEIRLLDPLPGGLERKQLAALCRERIATALALPS
ncbi:lysophospholipid acyltransferase family protein [Marinivivus vitaminiproducens]|uniref:lysophospholipid acyltransferase family protein n=1 Tax=Marinivivus vitaminiproducens TaxID=3035935 RepID=UPI0027A2C1DA|nr:lysophospholipid acyltransferase family protein [Geminicoccaceae bacterium SCSIO 64248]